jgi:6-pyruvoyltetrahydropterin/6-carboxytetrahydropterin synthase
MPYEVQVERAFRARQGLPSPVRARRGRPPLSPEAAVEVVLRAAVTFDDAQLTARGWSAVLGAGPWTARFAFRPTFELVARHVYAELSGPVAQLAWVELEDRTFGSRTRYRGR